MHFTLTPFMAGEKLFRQERLNIKREASSLAKLDASPEAALEPRATPVHRQTSRDFAAWGSCVLVCDDAHENYNDEAHKIAQYR